MERIKSITGHEILNAKGKPTVEVELVTTSGHRTVASVPSGTSRGKYEAHELYDNDAKRFRGFGCQKAVQNINTEIQNELVGTDVCDQEEIDRILIGLDGTENKERLGGNAILAVSVAASKASAMAQGKQPYEIICKNDNPKLPDITSTVIAGGVFGTSGLEFEDYLYILKDFHSFSEELLALCELRYLLEKEMTTKYGPIMEDGGALAPILSNSGEAFDWMMNVAKKAGYERHVTVGLDVAASELMNEETGRYKVGSGELTRDELVAYYLDLQKKHPLTYLEDPFDQDDVEGFAQITKLLPQIQIVGDDFFVTNVRRLQMGIEKGCCNTLLLKINQIGTVTEAVWAGQMAKANGYDITLSLRSGETTDDYVADFAVAIGARQMKPGSPVRAERNVKYNRLLRIEEDLRIKGLL